MKSDTDWYKFVEIERQIRPSVSQPSIDNVSQLFKIIHFAKEDEVEKHVAAKSVTVSI